MKYKIFLFVLFTSHFNSAFASIENGLPADADLYIKLIESTDNEDMKLILKIFLYKELYNAITSYTEERIEGSKQYYPDSVREDWARKNMLHLGLLEKYNPGFAHDGILFPL
jgi:hypothetical protein